MGSVVMAVESCSAYSTSSACRPPYHPQFRQTTWGCFTAPQREHVLRAGRSSRHALARLLRLLALEVFFFGTAIGDQTLMRWQRIPSDADAAG
jgi:hypothetical protein